MTIQVNLWTRWILTKYLLSTYYDLWEPMWRSISMLIDRLTGRHCQFISHKLPCKSVITLISTYQVWTPHEQSWSWSQSRQRPWVSRWRPRRWSWWPWAPLWGTRPRPASPRWRSVGTVSCPPAPASSSCWPSPPPAVPSSPPQVPVNGKASKSSFRIV